MKEREMATTPVKERPILFSAPMVQAILEGRKTQTRRVIKPQPTQAYGDRLNWSHRGCSIAGCMPPALVSFCPCPYGQPGDRLWVRESFWHASPYPGTLPSGEPDESCRWSSRLVHYAADGNPPNSNNKHYGPEGLRGGMFAAPDPYACWHKRPSIHMPRWASRILLEIVSVRVERLQAVSEPDAKAEGIERLKSGRGFYDPTMSKGVVRLSHWFGTAREAFKRLWSSINGADSWDANPWVWVVEFKRVEA